MRQTPRSTRTDTLFPYTSLVRARDVHAAVRDRAHLGLERPCDRAARGRQDHPSQRQLCRAGGSCLRGVGQARLITVYGDWRSEEHTSELQSIMRISYAVFCWKKTTAKVIMEKLRISEIECG